MTRRHRLWSRFAWAAAAGGMPLLASAHLTDGAHAAHSVGGALAAGFSHPFTGLDHLAAMVMVGWWSTLSAGTRARAGSVPAVFVAALLLGALLGLSTPPWPGVEPMIAVSLLAIGLLVATGRRLPWPIGLPMVAAFGGFHGLAHGAELTGPHSGATLTGMVLATVLLHLVGVGLGLSARTRSRLWAGVAGVAVALSGTLLLVARA